MAISQGSSALWSDINALYTTLRNKQAQRGVTQTTIPTASAGTTISLSHVNNLRTAINALSPGTAVPAAATQGALITATYVNGLKNSLNSVPDFQYFFRAGSGWLVNYTTYGDSKGRVNTTNNSFQIYYAYSVNSSYFGVQLASVVNISSFNHVNISYTGAGYASFQILTDRNGVVATFSLNRGSGTQSFDISSYTGSYNFRVRLNWDPGGGSGITVTNFWLS